VASFGSGSLERPSEQLVLRFLPSLAWLACAAYSTIPAFWLATHPLAGFWRAQRRSPFALLVPVWTALWIVVALITAPWRQAQLYAVPTAWVPAAVLFALGIWIYRRSGTGFSWAQLGGLPEIRESSQQRPLASAGIRAHIRHPVYLGHLLEMLAWSIGSGLEVCFILTAIAITTGAFMIAMEDRELESRFGEDYRHYKDNVPAIFPRRTPYNPNQ
jgi:protein-S-isoprenylcysteine O-methyltransferase Ste14